MPSTALPSDGPRPEGEPPITVPIRMAVRRPAVPTRFSPAPTPPERIVALHLVGAPETMEADETMTPACPVPVRQLSAAAMAASSAPAARQLLAAGGVAVHAPTPALTVIARPRLRVVRGQRLNAEYPISVGENMLGRHDDQPVDISLEDQEPADQIWTSRRHAVVYFQKGMLEVEDLNSLNGTFVNRTRVSPGQRQRLAIGDILQVGTVQMRVLS